MAITIAGCKRAMSLEEELMLLDPNHFKRARLDVCLHGPEDYPSPRTSCASEAGAAYAVGGGWSATESGRRRIHQDMDDDSEADEEMQLPADKRLRQMLAAAAGNSDVLGGSTSASSIGGNAAVTAENNAEGEAQARGWAETVVLALHGSPSVEEAKRRCSEVLGDFGAEVRQAAIREADTQSGRSVQETTTCKKNLYADGLDYAEENDDSRPQVSLQRLQHSNSVLWRAVRHLAKRCSRFEAEVAAPREDISALREQLAQSQEAQRRLAHSNEVLQSHLRVHLDACRGGLGVL
eukprot:TRINITY_DN11441_c0_g1_i1.p2 TRINITY_DN11441_c0_g1~~TRINITY_DN11441_c0_g1_i1.p2  ORF type:complete len:294 (+),score=67.13 TRINITY_DN11441_c0_g1_i1:104-985(+)